MAENPGKATPPLPGMLQRFEGALLGLALGDALGAPHEGGLPERLMWRMLGRTRDGLRRYTDDTQMSIDLADSLIACHGLDLAHAAQRFAENYQFNRGYGPGAARVLQRIQAGQPWSEARVSVYPDGSFGNGGAMRAPVIGLAFHAQAATLTLAARQSASITHAHPLAQEGAVLIAQATAAALANLRRRQLLVAAAHGLQAPEHLSRLQLSLRWMNERETPDPKTVRRELGMGISAVASCSTAVYLACRFQRQPLEDLLEFAAQAGGDVDTVGAMAGAIWGAWRGVAALPEKALNQLEGAERIRALAAPLLALSQRQPHAAPPSGS